MKYIVLFFLIIGSLATSAQSHIGINSGFQYGKNEIFTMDLTIARYEKKIDQLLSIGFEDDINSRMAGFRVGFYKSFFGGGPLGVWPGINATNYNIGKYHEWVLRPEIGLIYALPTKRSHVSVALNYGYNVFLSSSKFYYGDSFSGKHVVALNLIMDLFAIKEIMKHINLEDKGEQQE